MSALLHVLQYAVAAAYVLLGLLALSQWLRYRRRSRGFLALAVGSLGLVAVLGQLAPLVPSPLARGVLEDLAIVLLMLSGYSVLLFRGSFIPLSRGALGVASAAVALVVLLALAARYPSSNSPSPTYSPFQFAVLVAILAVWVGCVAEPIARFWISAGGLPRVQRSRLRALSLGFAGLVFVLVVSVLAGNLLRSTGARIVIQLVALASVPLMYASFSPPAWLRRTWREKEEQQFRSALQALLLFSPSRAVLAERAVEWAARLVGAESALLLEPDGSLLATTEGLSSRWHDTIGRLSAQRETRLHALDDPLHRTAIVQELPTSRGPVRLGVISGPFTPVFGSEEVQRLEDYATGITAGLDRTELTERITALERTKTQFLNLASHELRGPVTVLRGYLSMFQRGTLPPEQTKAIMPVLLAKTEEMNLLVEQMIEASRLEEGRLQLKLKRVDLREVVERSVELMRPLAGERHDITLRAESRPIPVEVDPERIATIVNNLLDNAVKYSPAGGEVTCVVERNGTHARVSVQDRGLGIDPAQLPLLFTRFGRIVTSETSSIRGTGLGLYLARELARLHGGDITVESQVGKGSTFVMAVPLVD